MNFDDDRPPGALDRLDEWVENQRALNQERAAAAARHMMAEFAKDGMPVAFTEQALARKLLLEFNVAIELQRDKAVRRMAATPCPPPTLH